MGYKIQLKNKINCFNNMLKAIEILDQIVTPQELNGAEICDPFKYL